jgi:hypothetical protein
MRNGDLKEYGKTEYFVRDHSKELQIDGNTIETIKKV